MLRYLKLRFHIWRMMKTNKELLERLNDYDENGCPYWKKTGTVDPDYSEWDFIDDNGDAFRIIYK